MQIYYNKITYSGIELIWPPEGHFKVSLLAGSQNKRQGHIFCQQKDPNIRFVTERDAYLNSKSNIMFIQTVKSEAPNDSFLTDA